MYKNLVLVTGAAGFTGSFVVRHLLECGIPVRAMLRNEQQAASLKVLGVECVIADLANPESLQAAVKGVSAIIHIAALFRQADLPDSEFFRINVDGTKALLDAACAEQVKRFIHCSTNGVRGHIANPPADESYQLAPGDKYQESKLAGEELVNSYFNSGKIRGVIIRPAMIWGPGDLRFLKLFKMICTGRFFYVGKGDSLVHFIDVRDLAKAFRQALEAEDLNAQTYLIAGKETMTLKQMVALICSVAKVKEPTLHLPVRPMQVAGSICEAICKPFGIGPPLYRRRVDFYTKSRSFNCAKAKAELGFIPTQDSVGEIIDILESYVEIGAIKLDHLSEIIERKDKPSIQVNHSANS